MGQRNALPRWLRRGTTQRHTFSDQLFDDEFLRRLELLQVATRRIFRGRQRAERKTRKSGSGLEFADHREYAVGDDIRNLDWQVLVRLGQPLIRLFEEDEDLPIRIVVDVSDSMLTHDAAKLRQAYRVAAALAYVGLANLDRVGPDVCQLNHPPFFAGRSRQGKDVSPPRLFGQGSSGRAHRLAECMQAGCSRKFATRTDDRACQTFTTMDGSFAGLNRLRFQKHEPVAIQIVHPSEANPASMRCYR